MEPNAHMMSKVTSEPYKCLNALKRCLHFSSLQNNKKLKVLIGTCIWAIVTAVYIISSSTSYFEENGRPACNCLEWRENSDTNIQRELERIDPLSGLNTMKSISKYHPNLPVVFLNNTKARCSLMPDTMRIHWTGVHWQQFDMPGAETFLLYSAFYDNRTKADPAGGVVRILSLVTKINRFYSPTLPWCHLWYEAVNNPVPVKVQKAEYIDWQYRSSDRLQTYVLTCDPAPYPVLRTKVPLAVSLVEQPCYSASNLLKVIGVPNAELPAHLFPTPGNLLHSFENPSASVWRIGVCGPALFYLQEDFSVRLVEWLEYMRALGVSQVLFYSTSSTHPNIRKVLEHYEASNYVELVDFHYPPPYVDEPLLRRLWTLLEREKMFALENIYFTDCILRYKDRYRFLAHFDPDEVPVLLKHNSLPELVAHLIKITDDWPEKPPSYKLPWQYFMQDVVDDNSTLTRFALNNPIIQPMSTSSLAVSSSRSSNSLNKTVTRNVHLTQSKAFYNLTHDANVLSNKYSDNLHIMRHFRKLSYDKNYMHFNVKSIYDTQDSTGVISHKVIVCATGPCVSSPQLSMHVAYMGHFTGEKCGDSCHEPGAVEDEPVLHSLASRVRPKVLDTLRKLQLL